MPSNIELYDKRNVLCLCTKRQCSLTLLIIGILLVAGGIVGLVVSPIMTKRQIEKNVAITANSFAANQWINPPFEIKMQFWLFNMTNSDEVLRGMARPSVVQKGPYTYRQQNQKSQIIYGDGDNVSYVQNNVFYYDSTKSCSDCTESDRFTVPNAVYIAVTNQLRFKDNDTKRTANLALLALAERPFITKSVSELLFQGFQDRLLTVAQTLNRLVPKMSRHKLPKIFQYFPKNNTNDGRYEIRVGKGDARDVGKILFWNGRNSLRWWATKEANAIRGTDGQLFPPNINRQDKLDIFISDLCRSASLRYAADGYTAGFETFKYILPPETFNSTSPGNEGFCQPTDKYYHSQNKIGLSCLPAGLMNLSACRDAPIILSMPHFLYASDDVVQSVDGMHPTQEHEASWEIIPALGAAVSVSSKFQINVAIHPDDIFLPLKRINPTIVPVFWLNGSAMIDSNTRDYIYTNMVTLQTVGTVLTYAVLVIGLLLLLSVIGCFIRRRLGAKPIRVSGMQDNHRPDASLIGSNRQASSRWAIQKL